MTDSYTPSIPGKRTRRKKRTVTAPPQLTENGDIIPVGFTEVNGKALRGGMVAESLKVSTKQAVARKHRTVGKPNARMKSLVQGIASGLTRAQAMEIAGFPQPSEEALAECKTDGERATKFRAMHSPALVNDAFKNQVATLRAQTADDSRMTRRKVMDGLLEAIDMARTITEPGIMIAGWKEVAKLCGFYEPVKVKLDLTSGGMSITTKLMSFTDEQLLQLAQGATMDSTEDSIAADYEPPLTGTGRILEHEA